MNTLFEVVCCFQLLACVVWGSETSNIIFGNFMPGEDLDFYGGVTAGDSKTVRMNYKRMSSAYPIAHEPDEDIKFNVFTQTGGVVFPDGVKEGPVGWTAPAADTTGVFVLCGRESNTASGMDNGMTLFYEQPAETPPSNGAWGNFIHCGIGVGALEISWTDPSGETVTVSDVLPGQQVPMELTEGTLHVTVTEGDITHMDTIYCAPETLGEEYVVGWVMFGDASSDKDSDTALKIANEPSLPYNSCPGDVAFVDGAQGDAARSTLGLFASLLAPLVLLALLPGAK